MLPHHQNVEREGGKGRGRGRDWGAQESSGKIEKPLSKEDPFRKTRKDIQLYTRHCNVHSTLETLDTAIPFSSF